MNINNTYRSIKIMQELIKFLPPQFAQKRFKKDAKEIIFTEVDDSISASQNVEGKYIEAYMHII